jgi:uncharacterized hydrophobic protein (TIGR00271 family)
MASSALNPFRGQLERLLGIDPAFKPRTYLQVHSSVNLGSLTYWLELIFSAGIATLGLVLNSPAVVIGAMLISPLMNPIIGAGLALAAADLYLGLKSLVNLVVSIAGAVLFSALLVWLLPFHSATAEILSRTKPNLLDLGVALLSGLAGSIVVARGGGVAGVTALPGVAIAVALIPPLCTLGFGVGSGFEWPIISGAGLLFLTNLAAIVASAFLIFLLVRLDSPEARTEVREFEHSSHDLLLRVLQRTRLSGPLADIGKLHWRVLMLVLVLGALFVPLRQGLTQVRDETIARAAVRDAVRRLVTADELVSQQTTLTPDRIMVRLIVTTPVDPARVKEAERALIRRTGKEVTFSIRKVAGEEELALLREKLVTPPPPAPPQDLDSIRADLVQRVDGPVKQTWPTNAAPLLGYEVGFTGTETLLRVRYQAAKPLDASAEEAIANALRIELAVPALRLVLENEPPPPPPRKARKRR